MHDDDKPTAEQILAMKRLKAKKVKFPSATSRYSAALASVTHKRKKEPEPRLDGVPIRRRMI